eukprot:6170292-Amphidinium_carterae.1
MPQAARSIAMKRRGHMANTSGSTTVHVRAQHGHMPVNAATCQDARSMSFCLLCAQLSKCNLSIG